MWKRKLITLPTAVLTITLLGGAEGIDPDELTCEAAVKHLVECCPPGSPATGFSCDTGRGCDNRPPDLLPAQAENLAAGSCEQLVRSGACKLVPPPPPPPPTWTGDD